MWTGLGWGLRGSFGNSEACRYERFRAPNLRQPRTLTCTGSLRGFNRVQELHGRGECREVDKIGRGHQGDPSSALLELLDWRGHGVVTCCARSPLAFSTKRTVRDTGEHFIFRSGFSFSCPSSTLDLLVPARHRTLRRTIPSWITTWTCQLIAARPQKKGLQPHGSIVNIQT